MRAKLGETLATRAGQDGDWPAISRLLSAAFLTAADTFTGAGPGTFEPTRSLVVTSGPDVVAHAGAYTRDLVVPGAVRPAAHVALVAVALTHRRRGLLSQLMRQQLAELREAGREAIAVLWASEGRIYHRYGYGLASSRLSLAADLRELRLLDLPPGRYRMHEEEPRSALPRMRAVYEQAWARRVGWSSRTPAWWQWLVADPPDRRYGATSARVLFAEGVTGAEGYAVWRASGDWDDAGPTGTVEMREIVAASPGALLALWRFLLTVDLTRSLQYSLAAIDDPVVHLIDEPRRLRATLADALWVRLVDVPAALCGRRYLVPVDLVIDVRDPLLPGNSGIWRLCGDQTDAVCTPADADPDLVLDVRDLAAAYLGGTSLAALGAAGRVEERHAGALAAASMAFGWYRQPSAVEMF